jgi:xanthine dehydrogenase accessory factor
LNQLLDALVKAVESGRPVAYCRLVETRGSTPQKPGATMLVYENGDQEGTLGGGCVEAEVKRRAIATLDSKCPEIATFTLDHDYGWDDGLICGGRMQVLIRPVQKNEIDYFRRLAKAVGAGEAITEAVTFQEHVRVAETPNEAPASDAVPTTSFLFDAAGQHVDSLPADAVVDQTTLDNLRPLKSRPRAYNEAGVAYLPSLSRCRLVIVGGGHVGQAVTQLASQLDFDVWVVDDREDCVSEKRFPSAQTRIHGVISEVLPDLDITPQTYCLVVTRGHNHDQEALFHLCNRGARYVGMIGSRRKIKLIFENLLDHGISQDDLDAVYAPLGIDIGSQTVPEIAVSICAELIAHRNLGSVPGRTTR